jgi:hypothetical protein
MLGWAVLTGIQPLTADGSADSPDSAGWRSSSGFRWRPLEIEPHGRLGFQRLDPASTGGLFTNTLEEVSAATNRVLLNGSGLATGDFHGNGRPDLSSTIRGLHGPSVRADSESAPASTAPTRTSSRTFIGLPGHPSIRS